MTDATPDLMRGMSALHLRFTVQATSDIRVTGQPGSALRGALYGALNDNFCSEPDGPHTDGHQDRCPVCWLLSREEPHHYRGANVVRPLTFQPMPPGLYRQHQPFTFGITLIGAAQNLLPYVARAVQKMGKRGIGQGRGTFKLLNIAEYSPLMDAHRDLMDGRMVKKPTLQVTAARVDELVNPSLNRITLDLLTPTRLIANSKLVKSPEPQVFVARLLERCQTFATYYAETDLPPERDDWRRTNDVLSAAAAGWTIAYDETEWVEAFSGSRRKKRMTPIGGLVGRVRWEGDIGAAHRWLLWGQSLHVGKDAVKGNGFYRIIN